jgi:hypothetical protein
MMLIGIHALRRHLTATSDETEQLASRVAGRIWELPEVNAEDIRKILAGTMGDRELEAAMRLLGRDEQLMSSPRRLGNVLEVAGGIASKTKSGITLEHLTKALRVAA